MISVDTDKFEKTLERFLSGRNQKHPDLTAYAPIAKDFIQAARAEPHKAAGIRERLTILKGKVLRCREIIDGFEQPDADCIISEEWIQETHDACTGSKGEISVQTLSIEITRKFVFRNVVAAAEFLRYDEKTGRFVNDAPDFIGQIVRRILPMESTTHIVNETIGYVKDVNLLSAAEMDHVPTGFINLQNGVFDISTGKLLPHDPAYNFRWVLPFRFNRRAHCMRFFEALQEITADNPGKAISILELFAWPFVPGYPIQKAAVLFGVGNNGKGVILSSLVAFLGRENVTALPLQTLSDNRFAITELRGKLANVAGDVGSGTIYDSSNFKQLTGGDLVSGEIKGKQQRFQFMNPAKMIFAFNQLARSWDTSTAFYRRFHLIELIQNFEGRANKRLADELAEEESLQVIFNFVASIFLPALLHKKEFEFSETAAETQQRYDLNSNPALAFINEQIEPEADKQIKCTELYRDFQEWCKKCGVASINERSFGYTLLKRSGIDVRKRRVQENGIREDYYVGITKSEADNSPDESGISLEKDTQTYGTFTEALNSYVQKYGDVINAISDICFYTLINYIEKNKRVQKHMPDMATNSQTTLENSQNTDSASSGISLSPNSQTYGTTGESPPPEAISDPVSVTPEEGKLIMDQLLTMGYHVLPGDSGPSIKNEFFKIAVTKPLDSANCDRLMQQMKGLGFALRNTGAIGPLIFAIPMTGGKA